MFKFQSFFTVACIALLTACSTSFPADPEGTLERVTNGTLRVGVSQNPPWVQTPDGQEPQGKEPDLIRNFAMGIGAEVEWAENGEEQLFDALERGDLDVVIGGFTDQTPWTEYGAVTRPYTQEQRGGTQDKHVMVVRMGENAFQMELEKFLFEKVQAQ
ncbi:transporter substrate-binding domain-containing protein [Specibacter sp. NPDC057265]|uniref:transporter substrate-binding domain-containing protein n=1 Tax=Specibacter sp. NPDC057265 TaxID=3346075 RepID=UPI00362908A8